MQPARGRQLKSRSQPRAQSHTSLYLTIVDAAVWMGELWLGEQHQLSKAHNSTSKPAATPLVHTLPNLMAVHCHDMALLPAQIYGLRELHEELSVLFSQEQAVALGLPAVLEPFARLPALHVSSYTAAAWASARNEHEKRLEAVEDRVSHKLKELFGMCH